MGLYWYLRVTRHQYSVQILPKYRHFIMSATGTAPHISMRETTITFLNGHNSLESFRMGCYINIAIARVERNDVFHTIRIFLALKLNCCFKLNYLIQGQFRSKSNIFYLSFIVNIWIFIVIPVRCVFRLLIKKYNDKYWISSLSFYVIPDRYLAIFFIYGLGITCAMKLLHAYMTVIWLCNKSSRMSGLNFG